MLKKILLLTLILNTSYIMPAQSSFSAKENFGFGSAALVSGILCGLLAHKEFKKVNAACKEVARQLYMLNQIGVTVYKQFQRDFVFGIIPTSVFRERYSTIKIPSHFSQQEKEEAQKLWSVLLANQKQDDDHFLALTAGLASLLLSFAGVAGIYNSF